MGKILCIIGCCKSKKGVSCKAMDMYSPSPQFRLCVDIAKQLKADILILSSKYGFLNPDTVIKPYSNTWMEIPRLPKDMTKERLQQVRDFNKKSIKVMSKKLKQNHPDFSKYNRVIILAPYHNTEKILKQAELYEDRFEFWFSGALGCFTLKKHLNTVMEKGLVEAKKISSSIRKKWRN